MKDVNLDDAQGETPRARGRQLLSEAVRRHVATFGKPVSLAGLVLVLPAFVSEAAAQTASISLSEIDGVRSVDVQADGSVRITLENGAQVQVGAGSVQVLADGSILVPSDVAEAIAQAAAEGGAADGFPVELAMGAEGLGLLVIAAGLKGAENVPAEITGETTGAVIEDDVLTTAGKLDVTDANWREARFEAQSGTVGTYGSFDIDAEGAWTYTADNALTDIQSLGAGETLTDSFTVTTADGTEETVTVTIIGTNDAAVIAGQMTGAVTEDDATTLTATGALSVTDADAGEASFVAQSGTVGSYGSFDIDAEGTWTYTADNAQEAIQNIGGGQTVTDSFTVLSADGTEETVTVTITGENDAAVILGETTGSVTEDEAVTLTATGVLSVTDVDAGEAAFQAQSGTASSYGSFDLGTDGVWTYTADNALTDIQSLADGQTVSDSFTVTTVDGTTETLTVTIAGVNDAAVIAGQMTGGVTEDDATTLTATDVLSVTDVDAGEASFVAQSGTVGTYGSFDIDAEGAWTYTADNALTDIQSLGAGETLTDSFTVTTADGTEETVTVTIIGTNDAAVIAGQMTGAVTEDDATTLTATGALSVTDADAGEASFVAQSGTVGSYGSFDIDAEGTWTYTADNAQEAIQNIGGGQTVTDSFTVLSADGTEETVTVTITGENDAAVILGETTGSVTEDEAVTLTATGVLSVTDVDTGEANFVAQSGTVGSYGSFDLGTDGSWSYAADNTQAAIQALAEGETLTDSFTVRSADGTEETVTVTITGVADAIELAALESDTDLSGFVINGVFAGVYSGVSVSGAGDVNDDGFDDFIVGAYGSIPNGTFSGASFVVFGKNDGIAVQLSDIRDGSGGFVINGMAIRDRSGFSVSGAGDVNGDGLDDFIVGAYGDDPNGESSGASFVVFGKSDGTAVQLSDIESGIGGFVINGVAEGDQSGFSVSGAGDVNGDGLDDLIVGAWRDDPNGDLSGASFVVFGKSDGTAVELSDIESGIGGFVINGVSSGDQSGISVSGAGDVNGDGVDDLIVGAWADDPNGVSSGTSFVVFGKSDGTAVELSDIESGIGGFVINGVSAGDQSGISVSGAGDVNGDGLDDLIVGARADDPNGSASGASFVVFGKSDGTTVALSDIEDGIGGFVINGVAEDDHSGRSVSGAGDVNGDGFDDLIVGAYGDDPNGGGSGASFVVFGKSDGTVVQLSDIESGIGGFVINGVATYDQSGVSVSGAGDVNGDGFDDLIVGAWADDPNGGNSGASFVIFGGDFSGAATQIGTTGDDDLSGTSDDDVIFAGTGDDTIDGGGGTDRISGGQGADIMTFRNLDGSTTVIDFDGAEGDRLDVSDFGFTDFAEFSAVVSADGPGGDDTRIDLDGDTVVILTDVSPDILTAD
ncbi:VCBS domain-containing protein, partial [Octadecabacter sp. G9-8]